VTGSCAAGYTPGSYGVGKCYKLFRNPVPLYAAMMSCSDTPKARLLTVQSAPEEQFIVSLITMNNTGWTNLNLLLLTVGWPARQHHNMGFRHRLISDKWTLNRHQSGTFSAALIRFAYFAANRTKPDSFNHLPPLFFLNAHVKSVKHGFS